MTTATTTKNKSDSLDDYRKRKKELDEACAKVRTGMESEYAGLAARAYAIHEAYKKEFGTRIPSEYVVQRTSTHHTGRALGGLKRALAAASKRGDSSRVEELNGRIVLLTHQANTGDEPLTTTPTPAPMPKES